MYHSVDDDRRKKIAISISSFSRQMQYLFDKRYLTITLDHFYKLANNGLTLPNRTIILTFDDGYEDNYSIVLPVLKRYNFVANFFITTDFIGTNKVFDWDEKTPHRRMILSWEEVKEISDQGMLIGSHTCTHALLGELLLEKAQLEIERSKAIIEEKTNKPVHFLSYPKSSFNADIKQITKRAGYWGACTIRLDIKQKQDFYSLERVGIYGTDNLLSFGIKLTPFVSSLQKVQLLNAVGQMLFTKVRPM